jgi:nucleotide-binding universal stress UspA family protein
VFEKILVPVDVSDKHQQDLDVPARLASVRGGQVTLLHVVEVIAGLWDEQERDLYDRIDRMASDHLAKLGRYLEEQHVLRHEEVVFGNRAHEIVRYAAETGTDVLTSHRMDLQNPGVGWGTVSYKVGILSQCPVLLVK